MIYPSYLKVLVLSGLLTLGGCAASSAREPNQIPSGEPRANYNARPADAPDYRGWDYLVQKLQSSGIDQALINSIYQNTRMPRFEHVAFKLNPVEQPHLYSEFSQRARISTARQFLKQHDEVFRRAENEYGVSRYIVAAILLIESEFGKGAGKELVIYRLSRVSSVGQPDNLEWNLRELQKTDRRATMERLKARAEYLEALFYPEIEALLKIVQRNNLDIFEIRGSRAGAFGMPQFLPSSYLRYAVDGNSDGIISLSRDEDAIHSVANYLAANGWKHDASQVDKERALWRYNRSNAYVAAVLKVAGLLRKA